MKNVFVFTILVMIMLSSCKDKEQVDQAAADKQKIENYLTEKGLEAESTASGLYYIIGNAGSSQKPAINSKVAVAYKGYLLDGTVFDEAEMIEFQLNQVIAGWQEGIRLIGEGGSITLLVPSALGYGNRPVGPIPANSVLVFEVTLFYFE
jgi:FKBP-type peptidyl-prolyl cis-trans isomerase FkpA